MNIIIQGHHFYVGYAELVVAIYLECVFWLCIYYWRSNRKRRWSKVWDQHI